MATLQVVKGDKRKLPPGNAFVAGLGWDPAPGKEDVDLDFWLLRKHTNGVVDAVFWGNEDYKRPDLGQNAEGNPWLATPELDVIHKGDDTTGAESDTGYDENIVLDLSKTPDDVAQYILFATIYDENAGSTLGMATNVICGVTEEGSGNELQTQLVDNHGFDVSVLICIIEKDADGKWTMTSKQEGFTDTMFEVAKKLGVVGFP